MMTRRKLPLVVVVLAITVFVSTPILGAVFSKPVLEALEDTAVIGKTTPLRVTVDPYLIGGKARLYAETTNGETLPLNAFRLADASFVIDAPVPAGLAAGETLTYYYYCASGASRQLMVSSGAVVVLSKNNDTDEPPAWR